MELRQLKYFKEACELQNFSEAARVLHISQSTLSQQIKQLEDELDVLLFDRIGKRVVPTEAGLAFLPYAVRAIRDAENGKQIIRDLKGIETGVLHVGVTYSMSPLLIAALGLFSLKSATKLFSVLLASKRPLITELADKLRLKYPLLPTISPCPTMRLEAIRSIIPISCRRYPKSV